MITTYDTSRPTEAMWWGISSWAVQHWMITCYSCVNSFLEMPGNEISISLSSQIRACTVECRDHLPKANILSLPSRLPSKVKCAMRLSSSHLPLKLRLGGVGRIF